MNPAPTWLQELRQLRFEAGNPAARDLAKQVDRSHTSIAEYFNGTRLPDRQIVIQLAAALTTDTQAIRKVINLYDQQHQPRPEPGPAPAGQTTNQGLIDALNRHAVALNNLASAIRQATKEKP